MSGPERIKQLEDNLTRALIVTIRNLSFDKQKSFVQILVGKKEVESTVFEFDLQSTSLYRPTRDTKKFLVILQRKVSGVTLNELQHAGRQIGELDGLQKGQVIQAIKNHVLKEETGDFRLGDLRIPSQQLNSVLQLIYGTGQMAG